MEEIKERTVKRPYNIRENKEKKESLQSTYQTGIS